MCERRLGRAIYSSDAEDFGPQLFSGIQEPSWGSRALGLEVGNQPTYFTREPAPREDQPVRPGAKPRARVPGEPSRSASPRLSFHTLGS